MLSVVSTVATRSITRVRLSALVAGAALAVAGLAQAQDASQAPNYGTVSLTGGFQPDPHILNLQAGGDIDASHLGGKCAGMISSAPDYRINYTPSNGLKLTVRVRSQGDTTLVINGPDGQWSCSDDLAGTTNPGITWQRPPAGVYDIWVGAFSDTGVDAQLRVTELE